MAVIHTAGDVTVTQVGPSLFTVSGLHASAIAYFDCRDRAERHAHDMADARRVSIWRADGRYPRDTTLIATYRRGAPNS